MQEIKEKLRIAVNQFYLNKYLDQPLISDKEYDELIKVYESNGSSVKDLVEWDSELKFENEPIEGLNKIAVEDNDLQKAVDDHFTAEHIEDEGHINLKYDGASIKAYYENGKLRMILGTPDEKYGIIRTKAFWNLFPHELEDKSIKALQGEVLVDCGTYGQLARNKANGLTNSKLIDKEVEQEAFIRIYNITYHGQLHYDYNRLYESLSKLPKITMSRNRLFKNDRYEYRNDIVFSAARKLSLEEIPKDTMTMFDDGNFQTDGVVVYSSKRIQGFKFYYTESAITTVRAVNYDIKHNGSYAATINFDTIIINDKNISNASSGGIRNMMNMRFGVGAKIKVILANLTIPKIIEVIEPSDDYRFPQCECGYQLTEEDIFGSVLKCTDMEVCKMKVDLWSEEHKNCNPDKLFWKDWLSDNFLDWMNWFKIDRWDSHKNCKIDRLEHAKPEISMLIDMITSYNYYEFYKFIPNLFNFSSLQILNLQINLMSVFHVTHSLLEIPKVIYSVKVEDNTGHTWTKWINSEVLESKSINIDFDGRQLIKIENINQSWIITNAMNGGGENNFELFNGAKLSII